MRDMTMNNDVKVNLRPHYLAIFSLCIGLRAYCNRNPTYFADPTVVDCNLSMDMRAITDFIGSHELDEPNVPMKILQLLATAANSNHRATLSSEARDYIFDQIAETMTNVINLTKLIKKNTE